MKNRGKNDLKIGELETRGVKVEERIERASGVGKTFTIFLQMLSSLGFGHR